MHGGRKEGRGEGDGGADGGGGGRRSDRRDGMTMTCQFWGREGECAEMT